MSESETMSQNTPEEAQEVLNQDQYPYPWVKRQRTKTDLHPQHHQDASSNGSSTDVHLPPLTQPQNASAAPHNTHHDLNRIIARAREDIRHLREELTHHEAEVAKIARERDEIQRQYTHLYTNFLEAVHLAAEDEIRQLGQSLRAAPQRLPKLLEPLYESLTLWLDKEQAEREMILRQKVEHAVKQADALRQQLIQEQETLKAEREKIVQQRQELNAQIKTRETWLKNRWFAKTWGTTALMFLILPAFQIYLLLEKAGDWNIILIPTTTCLVLTGLISLVRSRKKPKPQTPKP